MATQNSISRSINLALGRKRLGYVWSLSDAHEKPCECENLVGFYNAGETLPVRPHPNCFCDIQPFYKINDAIQEALGNYTPRNYARGHHPNQYVMGRSHPPVEHEPLAKSDSGFVPTTKQLRPPPTLPLFKDIPLKGSPDGSGTLKDPIAVGSNLELAARLISEGKHVRIETPREVSILVSNLATSIASARSRGENLTFDMCRITLKGKNLFCVESKDIPRVKMPQLAGIPAPGSPGDKLPKNKDGEIDGSDLFVRLLEANGISVKSESIRASHLKATQNQLDIAKVNGIADAMERGVVIDVPIFTTEDGYIIDGHHRWAASVILEFRKSEPHAVMMNSRTLGIDIGAGLTFSQEFADYLGIGAADVGTPPPTSSKPKATKEPPKQLSFIQEFLEAYVAKNYQPGHHPNQYIKGKGPPPKKLRKSSPPQALATDRITLPGGFEIDDKVFAIAPPKEDFMEYNERPKKGRVTFTNIDNVDYRKGVIVSIDVYTGEDWYTIEDPDTGDIWASRKEELTKELEFNPKDSDSVTIEPLPIEARLEDTDIIEAIENVTKAEHVGQLLEQYFKNNGMDLMAPTYGLNKRNAQFIGKALVDFHREFPEMAANIAYYGTTRPDFSLLDDPRIQNHGQVKFGLSAILQTPPGVYAQTATVSGDGLGNKLPTKHLIGFNQNYFDQYSTIEGLYDNDVFQGFHPPKREDITAAEVIAIHELGHVFHHQIDEEYYYNLQWGPQEAKPEGAISYYARQDNYERFAEAYTDLKVRGIPEGDKDSDQAAVERIISWYHVKMMHPKKTATVKEVFVNNILEAYVARNYQPGKHPNQYIKGKTKSTGPQRRYIGALDYEPLNVPTLGEEPKRSSRRTPAGRPSKSKGRRKREFNIAQRRVGADKPDPFSSREQPTQPFAQMPKYERDTARMAKEMGLTTKKEKPPERQRTLDPSQTFPGKGEPHAEREPIDKFFQIDLNNAKTTEEVSTALQEYWGGSLVADMTGVHVESAKELATAAATFKESFPEAAANLAYFGSISPTAETLNGPAIQNQPQVLGGLLQIAGLGVPGLYSHTLHSSLSPLGESHEPKSIIVFNPYYFDEAERINANYDTDSAEPYNYHVDRGEFSATFATAIHELGHVLENNIKAGPPLAAYEAWRPRSEGAEPEHVVSKMCLESGEERFCEAFTDYSLNGLPEDPVKAVLGDTIRVAQIVEEYKRRGSVKEQFVYNLLEAYTARNYIPGHHPNQYIKGKELTPGESDIHADLDLPADIMDDYNDENEKAGTTKNRVVEALLKKVRDNPDFQALVKSDYRITYTYGKTAEYDVVNDVLRGWAFSSGDDHENSVTFQQAIKDEFGLDGEMDHLGAKVKEEYIPGLRVIARAMYDNTQEYLASKGVKSLILFRGMYFSDSIDIADGIKRSDKPWQDADPYPTEVSQQPASSWSFRSQIARSFTTAEAPFKATISARVPVERILATAVTGVGAKREAEMIVLGSGADKVEATSWFELPASYEPGDQGGFW